ncbi:MAG: hypothetical protein LUH47_10530 [Clostridiales bacterium]|nr:hypothetical protein [Clostridiales bacterium]
MADKRSKTNKNTTKNQKRQPASSVSSGRSTSRRSTPAQSNRQLLPAPTRSRTVSQSNRTAPRTNSSRVSRTNTSLTGLSSRTRTGSSSSRSSVGTGRNIVNINDARRLGTGTSSRTSRTVSGTSSRTSRTTAGTSSRTSRGTTLRTLSGGYSGSSRTAATYSGEDNRRLSTRTSTSRSLTGTSSSRNLTGTSSRNSRTAVSTAQRRKTTQSKVVHKKVSGIGYEGAAQVFMALFLVVSVLYIGGNILRYALKNAVSYDTIQIGSIDTPKSEEGLIVRTETAYQSDIDGEINFLVPSEEKVKAGEVICTVKLTDAVASAEQSVSEINDNIISGETVKQEIDETSDDAVRFNLELKALADDAAMSLVALDTEALRDFTNNAQVKQETRNQSILSGSTEQSAEKQQAETVIAENSRTYTALEGGIVCLETDGLESELTYDTVGSLSEGDIKKGTDSSHVAGAEVSAGENIFKIITSNVWYIAAYIDSDYVLDWEEGDRHTIYLTDSIGQSLDMDVVVETFVPDNKKTFMVLKASKYMIDFMSARNLTFEIDKVQTGYKISNSSIVENTLIKIPAEYVVNGTVTKQNGTTVSVGEAKGDYAYFPVGYDTLVLHDVILNPDDNSDSYELTEVETRQGVYIMNTGIAQFYTIDTEGSESNSTHTILDPAKNTNLSIYDRVVVDPKNIEDEDMLYK